MKTEKEKRHEYYLKNKQKFIDKAKKWKKENPEKARESSKKSQAKLREGESRQIKKDKELKSKYNLSWEEYFILLEKQAGGCAICKIPLVLLSEESGYGSGYKTANVDHNHETGEVRGLLCNGCNQGLGSFRENTTNLRLAAEYLDAFNN